MEYYSAFLNSDTCRNMDEPWNIMLSEIRQTQKYMILLSEVSRLGKGMETQ